MILISSTSSLRMRHALVLCARASFDMASRDPGEWACSARGAYARYNYALAQLDRAEYAEVILLLRVAAVSPSLPSTHLIFLEEVS